MAVMVNFMCVFLIIINVDARLLRKHSDTGHYFASFPCSDENHMLLTPGVLTAGSNNRVCVSRFYTQGSALLTVTLLADEQTVTATRDLPAGDGGCIDVPVPQLSSTKAEFIANIRYPEEACTWESQVTLRVASGRVLLLQTEKPRYRPGETMRFRVLALRADLTPGHTVVDEVWLEAPAGSWGSGGRLFSWPRTRTRLGLAQLQYRLDSRAPHGRWTIRARIGNSQGSGEFWVGDYLLPPFQLTVKHSPTVLSTSERLVWNVCVRYPWGEATAGLLAVRLRGGGGGAVRTAVPLGPGRACHRHAAAARRLRLPTARRVIAHFSFQEEETGIWQNTTVISEVVDKRVKLEFMSKHRTIISPGLPYKMKIKATLWDGRPASNELVKVCRSPSNQPSELAQEHVKSHNSAVMTQNSTVTTPHSSEGVICDDAVTDAWGVARVMFTTSAVEQFRFYRFEATLHNDTSTSTDPFYLAIKRTGVSHAAFGPLSGDTRTLGSKVFVPLYLNLKNVMRALTVHFVVITRGGVIYRWGATTQCPIANSGRARSASRDTDCRQFDANLYQPDAQYDQLDALYYQRHNQTVNDSETLLDRHLLRVMLPIRVTHQMCPDSHLVAYFYYNGELVSASKHFEVEECFANKVEAKWRTRRTTPGSITSLELKTPGPALCALSAIDTAAKWMQPTVPTFKETVIAALERVMGGYRNLTSYDAAAECFLAAEDPTHLNSIDLTLATLAACGVRLLGAVMTSPPRRCDAPAPLSAEDSYATRSDFSETWLWRLVVVTNGSTTVEARVPDSITRYESTALCVARNGLGLSAPAVIQVFRDFFIHANGPKKLRRGDTTIIRYRIFNYLYESLAIQTHVLADPHLAVVSGASESACVAARASVSLRVQLLARGVGGARVSVRAKTVADGRCSNNATNNTSVSDEVIIPIEVEYEGIPVEEHRSMLLCGKGSAKSSISKISWTWPDADMVPGSGAISLWTIGDINGPLLTEADALVSLPLGCGEQNLARMASSLLALSVLDPGCVAAAAARDHVARGFARQLQYAHPTGGFSAFGSDDGVPSTWLTAFAVRYMRPAHQMLFPGTPVPPALERSERWLLRQQMENGCFRNEGQVFHRELKGGLGEEGEIANVALTAYVISSLVEGSVKIPLSILRNSLSCLRALPPIKSKAPSRVYSQALLAYTFMRLRRYEDDLRRSNDVSLLTDSKGVIGAGLHQSEDRQVLMDLVKMAKRAGDFVWWETGSLPTSVEATGYALLALAASPEGWGRRGDGAGAARWLSAHRARRGMLSTQDTLVALEAIAHWSSIQPASPVTLNVTATCGPQARSELVTPETARVPLLMDMLICDELNVEVEGSGCALVLASRTYSSATVEQSAPSSLRAAVSVRSDGPFDCDASGLCYCAAVLQACVIWADGFPEMALLEASLPGGYAVDDSLLYAQLNQLELLRRIEMSPNGARVTLYLGTRDGSDVTTGRGGHQCYNLHVVGPKARTKPGYVKVTDYYNPQVNNTQIYTIPEECPPTITHEKKKPRVGADNLYGSARSIIDGDPIISEEFDDLPLEDPLYENLKDYEIITEQTTELFTTSSTAKEDITPFKNEFGDLNYNSTLARHVDMIDEEVNMFNDPKITAEPYSSKLESDAGREKILKIWTSKRGKLFDATSHYINAQHKETTRNQEVVSKKLPEIEVDKVKKDLNLTTEATRHKNNILNLTSNIDFLSVTQSTPYPKEIIEDENEIIQQKLKENTNINPEDINKTSQKKPGNIPDNKIDNPNLSNFHVIDTEKDLDVPAGVEGPTPTFILPPRNFFFSPPPKGFFYLPTDGVDGGSPRSNRFSEYRYPQPRRVPQG